ncbi:MAG: hypothetical protein R2754_18090 [Microthrixaceae bacterium]
MNADDAADWARSLAWAEQQAFVSVGGWAARSQSDAVSAALAPVGAHHGARAEWWRALWPARRGGSDGPDDAVPPETDRVGGLARELEALTGPLGPRSTEPLDEAASMAALGGSTQVILPRLIVAYDEFLKAATTIADHPTRRVADLSLQDASTDWRALTRKLHALAGRPTVGEA